jgi:hypothetical protein
MALNQFIQWALSEAEQRILLAIQEHNDGDSWISVEDEDGNPNVPTDEREVLVFLCGDCRLTDERPPDAGWGLRQGYFDHDKQYWRVHGRPESYVTHWREAPAAPKIIEEEDEPEA